MAQPPASEDLSGPDEASAIPAPAAGTSAVGATSRRRRRTPASPDFLTIQEVADRMEISAKTVQRLIDSTDPANRIGAVRVGGQIRIPIGEYHRYAASRPAARP
jgi:excisionase family DNA binding protein